MKGTKGRYENQNVLQSKQIWLYIYAFVTAEEEIKDLEPSSYIEEISCKDVAQWWLAMMEDMKSLHKKWNMDLSWKVKGEADNWMQMGLHKEIGYSRSGRY